MDQELKEAYQEVEDKLFTAVKYALSRGRQGPPIPLKRPEKEVQGEPAPLSRSFSSFPSPPCY
jgi:hypothetical protein